MCRGANIYKPVVPWFRYPDPTITFSATNGADAGSEGTHNYSDHETVEEVFGLFNQFNLRDVMIFDEDHEFMSEFLTLFTVLGSKPTTAARKISVDKLRNTSILPASGTGFLSE